MPTYGHTLVFCTTLVVSLSVLWLVRNRAIGERFAMLWMLIAVLLLLASSVGYPYLFVLAKFVGVPYPPSALFFFAIAGLALLILELFVWISKLNDRTRILTQQLAILRERVNRELGAAEPYARRQTSPKS
jgi:hypothetical protein